jgi:hypothetical protein
MFLYPWLLMMKEQQNITSHDSTTIVLHQKDERGVPPSKAMGMSSFLATQ